MSRVWGLIFSLGVLTAVSSGNASAFGPGGTIGAQNQSLIVPVQNTKKGPPSTNRKKCLALNRCRLRYTRCYDKLVRDHKNIETSKIECVKPYQKCINASFSGFDFFFDRWFNPSYLDCNKY